MKLNTPSNQYALAAVPATNVAGIHNALRIWAADFMHSALQRGWTFRTFNVSDESNRQISRIEIRTSMTAMHIVSGFE